MRLAIAPLAFGMLLSIATDLAASVRPGAHEPRWCSVERASSAAASRQRLNLKPILASYASAHRPAPRLRPASHPVLVRFAPPAPEERVYRRMTAACSGEGASLLCPGYQLIGVEY